MSLLLIDSTNVDDIPASGMDAVAGYVGGSYWTWPALVKCFPNVPKLSIAVNSHEDAQCLDVESGDATPETVPGWLDRQHSLRPNETQIIYCPASWIPAVRAAAGSRRYLLWSAHYGNGQHRCGPGACEFQEADATQWDNHGPNGEHYDRTVMTPAFLAAFAPHTSAASPPPAVFTKPTPPPVNHNTGLATEKPWGAFPLPRTDWYGVDDGTAHSHSGKQAQDQRAIRQIQREVGVPADGKFGPQTKAAVIAWQKRHGLLADGKPGVHTWDAMTTN